MLKKILLATSCCALFALSAMAEMSLWVRDSSTQAAERLAALWNASHAEQIKVTSIPNNQIVTKIAIAARSKKVPDLYSADLIFMPDLMRAGILTDLTDQLKNDPNFDQIIDAYKDINAYEDKFYGTGFLPDVSVLIWNKHLFRKAGLNPDEQPKTVQEMHAFAKKIGALDDNTYGFYFSGACPGCNIFTMAPMMYGSGAKLLPATPEDKAALEGDSIATVLSEYQQMWAEGLIPSGSETDLGANFIEPFTRGNVGMIVTGGYFLEPLAKDHPEIDLGVGLIPGTTDGAFSSFVGGDVLVIPQNAPNEAQARKFITWVMSDEAQLDGLIKNGYMPTRKDFLKHPDLLAQKSLKETAVALASGEVPWALHFMTLVNADSSPWGKMIEKAVFTGDVDGAINDARKEMLDIAAE